MGAEESQVIGHVLPSGALCWWLAVLPARLIIPHPITDHRSPITGALRGSEEPAGGRGGTLLTPQQGQARSVDRNARLSHGHIDPEVSGVDLCSRDY